MFMKRWRDFFLQTKIFIAMFAVILTVISLTGLLFYYQNVSDLKNQTYSFLNTISKQSSKTLDLYLQDIEKMSLAIFTDTMIQKSLDAHLKSPGFLTEVQIRNDMFASLFNYAYPRPDLFSIEVYTMDKRVYSLTRGGHMNVKTITDSEEWQDELDGMSKTSYMFLPTREDWHEEQPVKVLSLVRNIYKIPIRDKLGAMRINIEVHSLEDLLVHQNENNWSQHMRILLVANEGHIVYDSHDLYTGNRDLALHPGLFLEAVSGDMVWEDESYLYSFAKSEKTDWYILSLLPQQYILSEQRKLQYWVALAVVVSTLMVALISYWLARQITSPLRVLMNKMKSVEIGVLNERMTHKGNDEIGVLSRMFNNMLDSISRLIREVYEADLARKSARLSALQAQINPHFLYNTLNIMKSISRVKGVEEVAEISETLSELFKYVMRDLETPVSLRQEMEHVHNYMQIQQYRFGDRFQIVVDIPPDLLKMSVPKLIVQPLVENALRHGLSQMKDEGRIEVRAYRSGPGTMNLHVVDNGQGIDDQTLKLLRQRLKLPRTWQKNEQTGVGLINIQQRIQLMYGDNYGLRIESHPGKGTSVILHMPFIADSRRMEESV